MIALLLAASLNVADPDVVLGKARACNAGMLHTSGEPALLLRPEDRSVARARKLGDLPKAKGEYAVMRLVDGCMVAAPVRFAIQSK